MNSGEYKVMGLAPYGEPKYTDLILKELIDVKEDGSFRLNMKYFNFATGLTMTNQNFQNYLDIKLEIQIKNYLPNFIWILLPQSKRSLKL